MVNCVMCQQPMVLREIVYKCYPCVKIVRQKMPAGAISTFDPKQKHGWLYDYEGHFDAIGDDSLLYLRTEAERVLPGGLYYEIRAQVPTHYGRKKQVAWYYTPAFLNHHNQKYIGRLTKYVIAFDNPSAYVIAGFTSQPNIITVRPGYKTIVAPGALSFDREYEVDWNNGEPRDCHCGHSWYDHIGWRVGTGDNRVSCRIVRCGCEAYTESLG